MILEARSNGIWKVMWSATAGIVLQCQHAAWGWQYDLLARLHKGRNRNKKPQILPVYTYVATSGNMATLRLQQPWGYFMQDRKSGSVYWWYRGEV